MTLRPHAMTRKEAAAIVEQLISRWPHPELDDTGLALEIDAILDTGLTHNEARLAIRHLLLGDHRWRPSAGRLLDVIRPARRPEFPEATAGPDWRTDNQIRTNHLDELARTRAVLAKTSRPATHTPDNGGAA